SSCSSSSPKTNFTRLRLALFVGSRSLDRDESNRVVAAGTQKALKAGLAETFTDKEGSTLYRLTAEGKEMFVHLNTVFADG
ncbi:hypothetical protein, partial [Burkholderia contaminans]|uniref:hypothetical protein n=1 Tax=Burkholderia contaminans TaxID=488447 RepID=UPI001C88F13A